MEALHFQGLGLGREGRNVQNKEWPSMGMH